ncbi:MAG: nucleoside deaminase [Bacteroidetes bacterium]|nr:nucleoside deaminase [Bacteroidota bacterium]
MKGIDDASYRSKALNNLLLSILLIVANSTYCSLPAGIQSGNSSSRDDEIHEIYMLLTYSILYKTWQGSDSSKKIIGNNIGALLVNPAKDSILGFDRNRHASTNNITQHAESRLIQHYLSACECGDLTGCIIYASLEPCAMCSGMMTVSKVKVTVYGETDPFGGKALERLSLNSSELADGYLPYPDVTISNASNSRIRKELDEAQKESGIFIYKFLMNDKAKEIYKRAYQLFINYQVNYPENQPIYGRARDFLEQEVEK